MSSCTTPLMVDEANSARHELYSSLLNTEESHNMKYNRSPCTLILTAAELKVCNPKKPENPFVVLKTADIVGASFKGKDSSVNKLEIVCYPLKSGCCTSHKEGNIRKRFTIQIDFLDNSRMCENWLNVIRYISSGLELPAIMGDGVSNANVKIPAPPSRHFLVVVNPVGGKRQGKSIWRRHVEPMLKEAGIMVTLLMTERANHAKDELISLEADPSVTFQAVLCIGGDGIVFEVVNGLIAREGGQELLKRLPVVHIPGGTANGLCKSVMFSCNEACTPLNASFVAIRGKPQALDLSRVTTMDGHSHISFLSLAWGLVSDVDILSESMRYLGETRLYIAAVYFMALRRHYNGRLRMKLLSAEQAPVPECFNMRVAADGWTEIEGPFILMWSMQTSHSGATIYSGPGAKLADGVFTLAVVQDMSRFELIDLLLGIDSGAHFQHPKVKVFKCTEYTLQPLTEKGIFSLDGEVVPYGPIEAKVLPSAATVLSL